MNAFLEFIATLFPQYSLEFSVGNYKNTHAITMKNTTTSTEEKKNKPENAAQNEWQAKVW